MTNATNLPTPKLHRHANGLRVIQYPVASKNVAGFRNLVVKLGFGALDSGAEEKLRIFAKAWRDTKADPKQTLSIYHALTGNGHAKGKGKALVPQTPDDEAREKRRQYQRNWNEKRKNGGVAPAAASSLANPEAINDLIGILISQMQTTSTTLKLLQDALQKR